MTDISCTTYNETHIIECTGHTGYAPLGEDILCSAVSILCLTIKEYLENALSDGLITNLNADIHCGEALIIFECEDNSSVLAGTTALTLGFRLLSESFPDHISFSD